jgi:hypothetical protein
MRKVETGKFLDCGVCCKCYAVNKSFSELLVAVVILGVKVFGSFFFADEALK